MTQAPRNPPRVAISQRIDSVSGIAETRDALDQNLARWTLSCGLLPYPVPNGLVRPHVPAADGACPLTDWLDALAPAAVILSGGNDIGAAPTRDATETILLDWAIVRRLPVLGICRGMQMLAHVAGGQLRQVVGHVRSRHRLPNDPTGWPGEVNSFHNWSLAACPDGYRVTARADDGAIEAIRHDELPWEGWMWHPERETPFQESDRRRLMALLRSAAPTPGESP